MPTSSAWNGFRAVVSVSRATGVLASVMAISRCIKAESAAAVLISWGRRTGVRSSAPASSTAFVWTLLSLPLSRSSLVAAVVVPAAEKVVVKPFTCRSRLLSSRSSRLLLRAAAFTVASGSRGSSGSGMSTRISASLRER